MGRFITIIGTLCIGQLTDTLNNDEYQRSNRGNEFFWCDYFRKALIYYRNTKQAKLTEMKMVLQDASNCWNQRMKCDHPVTFINSFIHSLIHIFNDTGETLYLSRYEYDLVNKIDTATKMFITAKIFL